MGAVACLVQGQCMRDRKLFGTRKRRRLFGGPNPNERVLVKDVEALDEIVDFVLADVWVVTFVLKQLLRRLQKLVQR